MNIQSILKKMYPEGSWQGQCYTFLHKLADFPPVGNSLTAKKQALANFGIPRSHLDSIKVGDILLTNESKIFGHGAMVNAILGNNLQLTESNFKLNGRVYHGRLLSANSPAILGVFRKPLKFALPAVTFPIQIPVMILLNNVTPGFDNYQFLMENWRTLLQHMANLQSWFWEASYQRIELIISYKITNLRGWEVVYTGPVMGGSNVGILKEEWFNQNVLPLAEGAKIVIFNMERKSWNGSVFDHPEMIELGYCYEKIDMSFPIKTFTVADQYDDYPPYYPKLGAYAKLAAHEICHGLYGLAYDSSKKFNNPQTGAQYNVEFADLTHPHFLGSNFGGMNWPLAPEQMFEDLDYQKLFDKLKA